MTLKVPEYIKKNWKSIAFILVIASLVLFNVKQYQSSLAIQRENVKINTQYQESLKREAIYNSQIADYKSQISKKDAEIKESESKISETEAQLQVSQTQVKKLSKRVLNSNTGNPDSLLAYIKDCDSLATIAPVLSDQVDTLKAQNKALVSTMESKSALQDSIIKNKDIIISDKNAVLAESINAYNKSVDKLVNVEKKLNKEKKRKNFWMKATIVLAAVTGGILATK